MKFRKSVQTDIDNIMKIIEQAQNYFKDQGINQWQDGYPDLNIINCDVINRNSYVLEKDGYIVATVMVSFEGEKTYDLIYEGKWISDKEYATIHRVAVNNDYKGLGLSSQIIKYIEELCLQKNVYSIKVDTHEQNVSMQKALKKNEFQYCGVIYLEVKSKRIAFEKVLN